MRVKILFGLEAGGGALKHLMYLINQLNLDRFEVTLIYSSRSGSEIDALAGLKARGVKVIYLQMQREISLFKDYDCLFRVIQFLRKNQFDIVHAHSSKAGFIFRIAAWLNSVPAIIYTPHCFYFQAKSGFKRSIYVWMERYLARLTSAIVVSEGERQHGLSARIAPVSKFININNAIDFKDYVVHERKIGLDHLNLPDEAVIVGAVGRLTAQKDISTLIKAAAKLRENHPYIYFVIAGEGEDRLMIQNMVKNSGLNGRVLLIGHQTNVDLVFSVIDIFVSTSLWEGLPYVILEAMYYKKPIVATDIGYQDVLETNESGYMVAAKDVDSLCEKIVLLTNDSQLRSQIGERNRNNLNANFSFLSFVRSHENLYSSFFEKSRFLFKN